MVNLILRGLSPKVLSEYSGFVIPETGELVVTQPEVFNYETVIQSLRDFLEAKPCPEGKKYCVIMDNAPWHKKAIRLIWTELDEDYLFPPDLFEIVYEKKESLAETKTE